MIKSLSEEQMSKFGEYVEKWIRIGTSTNSIDLEKAKAAAILSYKNAGLAPPTKFYVTKSPIDAIRFIQTLDPAMDAKTILSDMSYGYSEADWLSYYNYFQEVCDLKCCNKLQGLMDLAENSGWVSLYEDVVIFQERPNIIKFDDQKRLHCEDGPSIRFRDGFSLYHWHGVSIPAEWIEKKADLTPNIALSWENIEQRRCACEILGWARILRELNSKIIDSDEDPMIGTLLEVNIPDIGREKFLQVLCGTGRTFAIPVPPNCKTALEANAWTFGVEPETLRDLEVRT